MELVIRVKLGNATYHWDGDPARDPDTADGMAVAATLNKVAARISDETLSAGSRGRILDANGNEVGAWTVD